MAARDDSVIRGSLIACMIFLVLSIAMNFFLWSWGDGQAILQAKAKADLANVNSQIVTMENQAILMRAMLGKGNLTQVEFDRMSESVGADPVMAEIEAQFLKDMAVLGPNADPQTRNYPALPEFLVNAIRDRNEKYGQAREESTQIRVDADADIANARKIQETAEQKADDANKKLVSISTQFEQDRTRINLEKEQTRDALTKTVKESNEQRRIDAEEKKKLAQKSDMLQGTIESQKIRLNQLQNDRFETTQGEVRYVSSGGNVVTINLGSADALRTGVTFGVIDGDETRLQDAKVKATIQVIQIQGDHLAQARVVARPEIRNPIIPGDMIYSPFWAPGRKVKIALAGVIDIDGDKRPDNEAIKGMITAAGAEVVAEVSESGAVTGKLDASIRFLVIGEGPEIGDETDVQSVAAVGEVKARATELGLTIIPAWKLQAYLKIMNDSLTTPLGSAARGEDFPPDAIPPGTSSRLPTDLPDLYKRSTEGMQTDNTILPP